MRAFHGTPSGETLDDGVLRWIERYTAEGDHRRARSLAEQWIAQNDPALAAVDLVDVPS